MFKNSSTHSQSQIFAEWVFFWGGGDLKMVKGCKSSQSNDGKKIKK